MLRFFYNTAFVAAFAAAIAAGGGLLDLSASGDLLRSLCLTVILGLSLAGVVLGPVVREGRAAAFSLLALIATWSYLWIYAARFGQPFVMTAGGLFFPAALTAIFAPALRHGDGERRLRLCFLIALAYAAIYILAALAFQTGAIHLRQSGRLVIGADQGIGRASRLAIASAFVVFGAAYSLARFRVGRRPIYLAALAVFTTALVLAHSRGITLIATALFALYLITGSSRAVAALSTATFLTGAAFSAIIAFTPGFDPLSFIQRDTSGRIRSIATQVVQKHLPEFWGFGAGLPSGGAGYVTVTSSRQFFASDVGMVGVLFSFGIVGFALYTLVAVAATWGPLRLRDEHVSRPTADALALTGATMMVYSLQSPQFWGTSGTMFTGLLLACFAVSQKRAEPRAAPARAMPVSPRAEMQRSGR